MSQHVVEEKIEPSGSTSELPSLVSTGSKGDNQKDSTLKRRPWRRHVTRWSSIRDHRYEGSGTAESPFIVTWLPDSDLENPMNFENWRKWVVTMIAATSTLGVSMGSSMLSAAVPTIMADFPGYSTAMYVMVTSAYIIGFVFGPTTWAPLSEVLGRRMVFILTFIPFTLFDAGCSGAKSLEVLLVLRALAGLTGCSAMTNAGGTIADMFAANQRGLAMGVFAAMPFLGPAIGPVAGGFLSENSTWSWVAAVIAIFSFCITVVGILFLPETYSPVLLRKRAALLSKVTGQVYRSEIDMARPIVMRELFTRQLKMPWILLFKEPIVLLFALYLAVVYAILYMSFTSFPIIFEEGRGWSSGISGLAFVGITVGAMLALSYIIFFGNPRYAKKCDAAGGYLPPEERLGSVIVGAICLPVGLIILAWTGPKNIPWIAPILATVPYGTGIVFIFLGVSNYLVDAYLMYAASVLAGGTVVRSVFGVVFPLFTADIYDTLGLQKAGTLVAGLALIFVPCPIALWMYGGRIRRMSKYARQADDLGKSMIAKMKAQPQPSATLRQEEEAIDSADPDVRADTLARSVTLERAASRTVKEGSDTEA